MHVNCFSVSSSAINKSNCICGLIRHWCKPRGSKYKSMNNLIPWHSTLEVLQLTVIMFWNFETIWWNGFDISVTPGYIQGCSFTFCVVPILCVFYIFTRGITDDLFIYFAWKLLLHVYQMYLSFSAWRTVLPRKLLCYQSVTVLYSAPTWSN